jgi:hypothetical protein
MGTSRREGELSAKQLWASQETYALLLTSLPWQNYITLKSFVKKVH